MKSAFSKTVVLIGAGNVATHLGRALHKAGFRIVQVYSPGARTAKKLAKEFNAQAVGQLSAVVDRAGLYVLAVKDDALASVVTELDVKSGIVLHTAGAVDAALLKDTAKHTGVMYPLQTFSKERRVRMKQVPLCIEAGDKKTLKTLHGIASRISKNVHVLSSAQRRAAHLSAVFANNFSNHCYVIAAELLKENGLSFELLRPLIEETAAKAQVIPPGSAQTGPAKRGDKAVMKKHLELLKKHPQWKKLYELMSEDIGKTK